LKIGPRGSSRTRTFLEDNNTVQNICKPDSCLHQLLPSSVISRNFSGITHTAGSAPHPLETEEKGNGRKQGEVHAGGGQKKGRKRGKGGEGEGKGTRDRCCCPKRTHLSPPMTITSPNRELDECTCRSGVDVVFRLRSMTY